MGDALLSLESLRARNNYAKQIIVPYFCFLHATYAIFDLSSSLNCSFTIFQVAGLLPSNFDDALQLDSVLGRGAGGTVFKGEKNHNFNNFLCTQSDHGPNYFGQMW